MTHSVNGPGLRCEVHADRGGRIVSLLSDDGYEWLAPSTRTDRTGHGQSFVRIGMGGWDEIAPTVQADSVRVPDATGLPETQLPDHGDIWNVEWQLNAASPTSLSMSVQLASVPVKLERIITASPTGLRLSYRASTTAQIPQPLLWCAHPQFAAGYGVTVSLEADGRPIAPTLVEAHPVAGRTRVFPVPPLHESLGPRSSMKAFVDPSVRTDAAVLRVHAGATPPGVADISGAARRALRISWNPEQLPYLGLFWDNGEFAASPVVAVEPSTAWGERLSTAAQQGRALTASREAPLEWHLDLAVPPFAH